MPFRPHHLLAALLLLGGGTEPGHAQEQEYERPPISYSQTPSHDAVARLLEAWRRGEITFSGSDRDVLRQLLKALEVPLESQLLVFSKTSLQIDLIRPENPRALYFNDLVYIGWVPGGDFEVAAFSPGLGMVFYRLSPEELRAAPAEAALTTIERDQDCLRCHGGIFSDRVPGVFIRSVPTGANGSPRFHLGSRVVTHSTPLEERWGGYYVTGGPAALTHLGNAFTGPEDKQPALGLTKDDLSSFFDVSKYPATTSDIVALMVMEHQATVLTALTKADFQCRQRHAQQLALQREMGEAENPAPNELTLRVWQNAAQDVLDALLFKDEAPLPEDGIIGGDAFREAFARRARPLNGKSLRDFQLVSRLFKYRCSYLIESEAFASLFPPVRELVLARLRALMTASKPEARYGYLRPSEREVIHQLLTAHVPGYATAKAPAQ